MTDEFKEMKKRVGAVETTVKDQGEKMAAVEDNAAGLQGKCIIT